MSLASTYPLSHLNPTLPSADLHLFCSCLGVCRYAEMDPAEKNKISHRGRAMEKLKAHLLSL